MCGVFGFVAQPGQRVSLNRLQEIASITEKRGPHAFGFAWIDGAGRLRSYKQTGRITKSLDLLTIAADARMLIGHTRYATQGNPSDNVNNHPHPVDGGWFVHNGVIRGYQKLIERYELLPSSDCDSEVLGLLIEHLPGTMVERCAEAVRLAATSPLAMLGLWRSPDRLIAVRAGNPLNIGQDATGYYLGSFAEHLPHGTTIKDETVLSFRHDCNKVTLVTKPLELPARIATPPRAAVPARTKKSPAVLGPNDPVPASFRQAKWWHE
jgi:glutamine---fructose-6-phosphate transaminase (isomerizing)